MPGAAASPAIEEMLTIDPAPEARSGAIACLQPSMTDSRLTAWTLRQCSSVSCSAHNSWPPIPALFTRMLSPPMSSTDAPTTRTQSSSRVTSCS